ncbi:hypothetical protein BD410DRAFT_892563 [Rickenella mellea]|uniref:Uncharacterized protein n=1 Tax=Rickenella mellea TaxID=50990 RepID=A0A4R5XDT1_9AGAM|nr:hypothetical protein BD410DRAFT_892563 [Rickenella mellea]
MESQPLSPPPYRKDPRNQRIPLLRSTHPSYGPTLTQNVTVNLKTEISGDTSTISWKMVWVVFGLLIVQVVVFSVADLRTPEEREARRKEREKWNYRNSGMRWDEPRPLRCVKYGIREYTAHLLDIPTAYDRRKGCEYMPVTINGFTFESPTGCEDRGWWSGVFGHWHLSNQTTCMPYWDKSFEDVGCTGEGSGKHRLQARLWNLQHGDNWHHMCETTPAIIHGVGYPSPTNCHDKGIIYGMYGIWDIDDPNCLYLVDEVRKEYGLVNQTGQE